MKQQLLKIIFIGFTLCYVQSISAVEVVLSCSPKAGGTITSSGYKYTAHPNSGYKFAYWKNGSNTYTANPVDLTSTLSLLDAMEYYVGSFSLTAYFTKVTTYTITWKNYDGSTLKTTQVEQGKTPSYTGSTPTRPATAQYAYVFKGWTPSVTAATANKTYTATYTALQKYTITFNANGGVIPANGNMGNTPSGHTTTLNSDRTSGTVVVTTSKTNFQNMANDCPSRDGYTFEGWYTDPTSGEQVYSNTGVRVAGTYWDSDGKWIGTSNVTLYAHWAPNPYTISTSATNGIVEGGGTYNYGTDQQLLATPDECYEFIQWSDGNTDNPRLITVTGNATYTAEFVKIEYIITTETDNPSHGSAEVVNN